MKRYFINYRITILVVSVKAQTTNSTQQNTIVNVDFIKLKIRQYLPKPFG